MAPKLQAPIRYAQPCLLHRHLFLTRDNIAPGASEVKEITSESWVGSRSLSAVGEPAFGGLTLFC